MFMISKSEQTLVELSHMNVKHITPILVSWHFCSPQFLPYHTSSRTCLTRGKGNIEPGNLVMHTVILATLQTPQTGNQGQVCISQSSSGGQQKQDGWITMVVPNLQTVL